MQAWFPSVESLRPCLCCCPGLCLPVLGCHCGACEGVKPEQEGQGPRGAGCLGVE